tara:strand:+ start:160 stop:393 length:234 start_codon:yes stop_codon:yes gene_type:complete
MAVMDPGKTAISLVKTNYIGAVAGAGISYYAIKKKTSITKMWMVVGLSLLGGVAGAYAQSMIKSKGGSLKSSNEAKK